MIDTDAKDPIKQRYPNWLNWAGAVGCVAMAVVSLVPGGQWNYFPFLGLMAFILIKKGIEKRVWELGDKLVMPVLTFTFVAGFIQGIVTNAGASTLWYNGGMSVLGILLSVYQIRQKTLNQ
tara:strand:- start:2102 stop:2464 length:363 start_codon:yes stop_codon:yes gene_type:complete